MRELVGVQEEGWHEATERPVEYLPGGGKVKHLQWETGSVSLLGWKCIQTFGERKSTGVATYLKRLRFHREGKGGLSLVSEKQLPHGSWDVGCWHPTSIFSICFMAAEGLSL